MLMALASLFYLIGFAGSIVILIHAFKESVGQGFMCLCIPCYVLYYAFAKFEHPKKNIVIAMMLGGNIIGGGLYGAAAQSMAASQMQQMQQYAPPAE